MTVTKEQLNAAYSIFRRCHICLYGPPGVGKTTLACSFLKPGLLAFEPRYKFIHEESIAGKYPLGADGWDKFRKDCSSPTFSWGTRNTLIMDTADQAYNSCADWICREEKIKTLDQAGQGKGWALCDKEFRSGIQSLVNHAEAVGAQVIFISHVKVTQNKLLTQEWNRIDPSMPTQCERTIYSLVDWAWYLGYDMQGIRPDGKEQELPQTTRKQPDLRAVSPNRILIFDGGETFRTKMGQPANLSNPVFPTELRQLPKDKPFKAILRAFAEGMNQ